MMVVQDTVRRAEAARPSGTASSSRRIVAFIRRHAFALAAVAIVLLAAVLRLWRLDMAEFKGDELQVTQLAFQLALHGQWPDRGILSSLGTYNSPLFIYLEALPALFWASPLALTALVAALNVASVAMAIIFARRYFGSTAALVAGLLFATAPWAVVYSRKIWEQDALPPVVLAFFFALFAVVVDRKPRALLLCGLAAGVAIQLHPSAAVLPVIAFIALLLWPRRFPWRSVVAAIAMAVLTLLPYLNAEWQHGFADWHSAFGGGTHTHLGPALGLLVSLLNWAESVSGWQALGMFTAGGAGYHDPGYVVLADIVMWGLLAGAAVHLAVQWRRVGFVGGGPLSGFAISPPRLGESQHRAIGSSSGPWRHGAVPSKPRRLQARSSPPGLGERSGEGACSAQTPGEGAFQPKDPGAGASPPLRSGERALPERPAETTILLTLWLLVPPLLLGLSGLLTFPHYFIAAYPAPFLAIGVLVDAMSAGSKLRRGPVVALVAGLALANVATVAQVLVATDRSPFPNDYGLPLAFDESIAGAIAQDAVGRPYAISVAPAFRDGQQVVDQVVAWKARPANRESPLQYWVLPAGTVPPSPAHLLLPLGPSPGSPVANVWAGTDAARMDAPK
jgi:4-amino-4-deoxy-L-arabinose transferase-like glycosyltransferase